VGRVQQVCSVKMFFSECFLGGMWIKEVGLEDRGYSPCVDGRGAVLFRDCWLRLC
jgi:hypothetical protein